MHPHFLGKINFELGAPQVPLVIGETFGEGSGPWRLTGSEPRPAQIWEPEIAIFPEGPRGSCGTSNCSSHSPESPHIYICGSRMKIGAARTITVGAVDPREARF